jgi:hypothetical protein
VLRGSRNSLLLWNLKALTRSQKPISGSHLEAVESSSHPHISFNINSNIIPSFGENAEDKYDGNEYILTTVNHLPVDAKNIKMYSHKSCNFQV